MAFVFVSGNLALDFVGTLKWRRNQPEELLATPHDLARWAIEATVLTEHPTVSQAELERLRDLREAIYRLVIAMLHDQPGRAEDRRLLNSYAEGRPPRIRLDADGVVRTGNVESIGWVITCAAAELLAQAQEPRMRECARANCTRIFIDRSRTGNRRWCGMQECGNRIKAANYRARKTPTSPVTGSRA